MEAASTLLMLAQSRCASPPRRMTIHSKEQFTPPDAKKTYKMTGLKRVREDVISLTYANDDSQFSVSVPRGMTVSHFLLHREKAAMTHLETVKRLKVYVTWKDAVISIDVDLSQWHTQRLSAVQRRYSCGLLQLVMCRLTCTQRKSVHKCRACDRQSRTSCTESIWLNYLMPVQQTQNISALDDVLASMSPVVVNEDCRQWSNTRMPQITIR